MINIELPRKRARPMYEIVCEDCGQIGVHPSRVGAESRGELHNRETGHDFEIEPM